jgi:hypothetical protein
MILRIADFCHAVKSLISAENQHMIQTIADSEGDYQASVFPEIKQ